MAVDKNVYALSISLQLESAAAFSTLEEFGGKAAEVEQSIASAAKHSIDSISSIVDTLDKQLSSAVITTGQFAKESGNLEANLALAAASLKDAGALEQDSLKDIEEKIANLEKINDIYDNLERLLKSEHKLGEAYPGIINTWIDALEAKNLVHIEEANLVKAEGKLLDNLGDKTKSRTDDQKKQNSVLKEMWVATNAIWGVMLKFEEATENFTTANYRAYDSQQQMVNTTRQLSLEYGIFREEALATYKALADVKTPREEIYKLAGTVGRANRITGVGVDILAQYSFQLRGAGFDADRTRKQIDMLSAAQRKFGLSTYDVQKAIESQTLSVGQQIIHFGKDAPEAFMRAALGLKALDKQLGTNSAEDWMERLQLTGVESEVFWQRLGLNASASIEDKFDHLSKAAAIAANSVQISMKEIAEGGLSQKQRTSLKIAAETHGITENMIYQQAKAQATLTKEQQESLMTMAGVEKAFAAQIAADKRWNETMSTLTAQLNSLKSSIAAVGGYLVSLMAEAILPFLMALNWIIQKIAVLIGLIGSAIDFLEKWIPGFSYLTSAVRMLAGGLIILVLAYNIYTRAMAAAAAASGAATGAATAATTVFRTVGRAIVSMAVAIGQSIRAIFIGLGRGLAALGNSIRPVIIPLMQLGVAVLLVGAGFWLMGMGIAAAAEHGWAAVGVLTAMTVAMVAMIVALAVVATVAAPVIPLIVALAFAVLLLGAATALAGIGMKFIGDSVEILGMHGMEAAKALPLLALGVIALGAAGWLSSAGILWLAAAFLALSVPILLITPAIVALASMLQNISAEKMTEFADALLDASWKIFKAIPIIGLSMLAVVALAPVILFAGAVLAVAGVLFVAAATLIGYAAKLLGDGLQSLGEGAKAFKDVDFISIAGQLAIGAFWLIIAGPAFVIGATLVGIGALILGA